jgi:hypothetical protein
VPGFDSRLCASAKPPRSSTGAPTACHGLRELGCKNGCVALLAICYYANQRSLDVTPFRFGDVATGEHFTNRTAELKELVGDLRSGQSVLVISPRRYGKTSLITTVLERVRFSRLESVRHHVEMGSTATPACRPSYQRRRSRNC